MIQHDPDEQDKFPESKRYGDSIKDKKYVILIGFCCGLASLTTLMIPALSVVLAITGLIFSIIGMKGQPRNMAFSGLAMSILAMILDFVYWLVVTF